MASEYFVVGESKGEVSIINGPNDWDLWLSLRGTLKDAVSFITDNLLRIPPFQATLNYFPVRVTLIEKKYSHESNAEWFLRGNVWPVSLSGEIKENSPFYVVEINYNSNSRKGFAKFTK